MPNHNMWKPLASAILFLCLLPAALAFDIAVTKEVDNPNPTGPNQTVEFRVTVKHLQGGSFGSVVISDQLPPELQLPEVMTPYTSLGEYDIESGEWRIDSLVAGQQEVLTVPAIYKNGQQVPCAVNIAKLLVSDDVASNNESRAALRDPATEACVDLWISASKEVNVKDPCHPDKQLTYTFNVINAGPDDARNVRFSIEEIGQFKMPGLHFLSPECQGFDCNIELLEAGNSHSFQAQSKVFKTQPADGHTLRMSATTQSVDYLMDNNSGDHNFRFGGNEGFCLGGDGSGGAAGCFIATAAYGTPLDERISVLRHFRDRWLVTSAPGRVLVEAYYRYSPPIAKYIADDPARRAFVRVVLYPIVLLISYPLIGLFGLLAILLFVQFWHRKDVGS